MFKKIALGTVIVFAALMASESVVNAATYVRGYYRSNGTYVQPHYRSDRDNNFYNNWSTYPNVNPYTGRMGTRRYPSYVIPPITVQSWGW